MSLKAQPRESKSFQLKMDEIQEFLLLKWDKMVMIEEQELLPQDLQIWALMLMLELCFKLQKKLLDKLSIMMFM